MKQALTNKGIEDIHVSSAGLGAMVDHPAAEYSCQLMSARNLDISRHRARQINADMVKNSDLILVMETEQKKMIEEKHPSAKGKIFLLGHWHNIEIPDPFKKDLHFFEKSLELIEISTLSWMTKLGFLR